MFYFYRRAFLLLLLLLFLIYLPCIMSSYQIEKHEVKVTLKLIQVYVEDKEGNPVDDLKKSDFIVYDNGKEVNITEFEKHFLSKKLKRSGEIIPDKKGQKEESASFLNRKFFFFFDFEKNGQEGINKSKELALNFLKENILPSDEVAVLVYSTVRGLEVCEQLTTDHLKIIQSIKRLKSVPGGVDAGGLLQFLILSPPTEGLDFRQDFHNDQKGLFSYESDIRFAGTVSSEKILSRQIGLKFIETVKNLADSLKNIPGNKNIVYFSAGYVNEFFYTDHIFRRSYQDMVKELSASNCLVFAVSTETPLGVLTGGNNQGESSLKYLAKESGGRYFGNIDNSQSIVDDLQKITGNYYVLGYYLYSDEDGKYHKVKVKLRGGKGKNLKVIYQKGYYNLNHLN